MQKSVFCAMRTQIRKTNSIQKDQGKEKKRKYDFCLVQNYEYGLLGRKFGCKFNRTRKHKKGTYLQPSPFFYVDSDLSPHPTIG